MEQVACCRGQAFGVYAARVYGVRALGLRGLGSLGLGFVWYWVQVHVGG